MSKQCLCVYCGQGFEVGGRGNARKAQRFCSGVCSASARGILPKELEDETWLRSKYETEKLTMPAIAILINCSPSSVKRALHRFGIAIRSSAESLRKEPEKRVCATCQQEFKVGGRNHKDKRQVYCSRHCHMMQQSPRQTGSHVARPRKYKDTLHSEEWLRQKYLIEKLSTTEIGALLGCPPPTVKWTMKKFGVTARSTSESLKVLFDRRGRKDVTQIELIVAYGGRCACCDEKDPAFLTLDHIGGGGNAHRRSFKGNYVRKLRQELKRLGWPKDKYRLLCMNCQISTRYGRTCPHQLKKDL